MIPQNINGTLYTCDKAFMDMSVRNMGFKTAPSRKCPICKQDIKNDHVAYEAKLSLGPVSAQWVYVCPGDMLFQGGGVRVHYRATQMMKDAVLVSNYK
jgi:hypothetical protein